VRFSSAQPARSAHPVPAIPRLSFLPATSFGTPASILALLLLETSLTHVVTVFESDRPLAIVSACWRDRTNKENLERNKRLAAAARDTGFGFYVIQGHWAGSPSRQWLVVVVADANRSSHLLGHCRMWAKEFDQYCSVLGTSDSLIQFARDGSRKGVQLGTVRLEPSGITLHDGRSFTFERAFQTAGWFTGLAQSRGANVGVTI
jgi:hypothetical protein